MSRDWGVALAIATAGALLYLQTLGFEPVLDDAFVVSDHPAVAEGACGAALAAPYWPAFATTGGGNWRPGATASWCVERALVQNAEAAVRLHHAVNVLLYGGVVLALFPVARRLTGTVKAGWVVCGLFALHASHTEVVPPLVGRTDLLAALGVFLMCAAFWRYREEGAGGWLALSTVGFAVGIAGKEAAAPSLLLLPLSDLWLRGERPSLRSLRALTPLLLVAAAYAAARLSVLGAESLVNTLAEDMGVAGRSVFAARNAVLSFVLLVAPLRFHHLLTTVPSDAPFAFPTPDVWPGVLWLPPALAIGLGWWWLRGRSPVGALCWVAALVPWLPASGLLPAGAGLSLRFLFISSAFAICGAVIAGQALGGRRPAWRAGVLGVAALYALVSGVVSFLRIPAWGDNGSFYRSVLVAEPRSITANYGLGAWIAMHAVPGSGDMEEARTYFRRAIEIAGSAQQSIQARTNLALSYEYGRDGGRLTAGADPERALRLYEQALEVDPSSGFATVNAASVAAFLAGEARSPAARRRYVTQALALYERALVLLPGHPMQTQWHQAAGELNRELGRSAEAAAHLRKAAER